MKQIFKSPTSFRSSDHNCINIPYVRNDCGRFQCRFDCYILINGSKANKFALLESVSDSFGFQYDLAQFKGA